MSGTSVSLSITQVDAADDEALMGEIDRMEAELGVWLASRAALLAARRKLRTASCGQACGFRPSLWRTLIQIWATSPEARARFSEEARAGLIAATESMNGRMVQYLVDSLLDAETYAVPGPAAA